MHGPAHVRDVAPPTKIALRTFIATIIDVFIGWSELKRSSILSIIHSNSRSLVRPIRIGPEIMKTKIPIIYSRIRKEARWCYAMTNQQIKKQFWEGHFNCLESAAEETAALILVTEAMAGAAAAV